ncbi:DUF2087 domain-containing protein [Salipaludibacillus sp. HK11]|uniref:DUF2087 domain-containing protein n=1 Tax=Salipaludibacillus sp. HK11 TaxID=3394320 RepID=UPI0039FBEFEE
MHDYQRFWEATVEELSDGYIYEKTEDEYVCLLCNHRLEGGVIYQRGDKLLEAKKAIIHHINEKHGSVFDYLMKMDKKYTGLSEHQKELLNFFQQGLTDKEIVQQLGGGSTSTIRNYRFKFKEKEKQAKVFLTIMNTLKQEKGSNQDNFVPFHKGATMVDDRYATTLEEKEKVLHTYFKQGLDGPLDSFPKKEKRKISILQHILKRFDTDKIYTEKEVNQILELVYDDFATIRRYFIEYGFMERKQDCSEYWIKN